MPNSGSKRHRLRIAVVAAALAAVIGAAAWTLIREHASPAATAATTTGATATDEGSRTAVASKPAAQVGHAVTTHAPPPPGTPLVQTYDQLDARANAGDAEAASRLFREARDCFRARIGGPMLTRSARALLNEDASHLSAGQLRGREERLADLERDMQRTSDDAAKCDGLSDAQLQLVPLTFRAAQLGDAEASACYVNGLLLFAGGLLDHPEWLAQYKSNALQLAEAGVQHGNWQMVAQLRAAYGGELTFTPLAQVVGTDPVKNYRYMKLQWLAAPDGLRARLKSDLAGAAGDLSVEQLASADAWAQDAYARYFGAQPTDDPISMSVCQH
jgi:hypothetical protein